MSFCQCRLKLRPYCIDGRVSSSFYRTIRAWEHSECYGTFRQRVQGVPPTQIAWLDASTSKMERKACSGAVRLLHNAQSPPSTSLLHPLKAQKRKKTERPSHRYFKVLAFVMLADSLDVAVAVEAETGRERLGNCRLGGPQTSDRGRTPAAASAILDQARPLRVT